MASIAKWCRRCAACLALVAPACQGGADKQENGVAPPPLPEEVAIPIAPKNETERAYYRAYLLDVLDGNAKAASINYREVVQSASGSRDLVARAALRLATWAASNHERVDALDLAIRASVLGSDNSSLKQEADAIRRSLALTVTAQDIDVRGPAAGTELVGVPNSVATAFAEAEVLLAIYHRKRLKPRLEELSASIRGKEAAMERAIRAYRDVASMGSWEATLASEFRIASLYYDYSLSLSFELPPELSPESARSIRSSLRSEVGRVRAEARDAYIRALGAAAKTQKAGPWTDATRLGLASVEDLLQTTR